MQAYDEMVMSAAPLVGEVPNSWGRVRVFSFARERKDVATNESNQLLSISEYFGVAPRSEKFKDSEGGSREGSTVGYKIVHKDDLAMNYMLAWKGAQGVSQHYGVVSPAYSVFELDTKRVSPRFIHHLFRSKLYQKYFKSLSRGIMDSRLRLYPDTFLHLAVNIPDKVQQEKIADFLDTETAQIDNLIAKQERLLELLEEKRRATITHVVTRGLNPSVELKETNITWLGQIPAHWTVEKFSNLYLNTNAGEVIPKEYWDPNGVELLYTASQNPIHSNFATFPQQKRTSRGDILIARNGDGVIHDPQPGSIYTNVVQRIRLDTLRLDKGYIIYALNASLGYVHGQSNGDFIVSLNMGMWNKTRLALPKLSEQRVIREHLDSELEKNERLKQKIQTQITLLRERRTSLISHAVTGKVKI